MALDGARAAHPLRVAICLAHFHPVVGGAERQMFQLARRWASWGHEPAVFTRRVQGLPRREVVERVEILRVIRTVPLGPLFGMSYISSLAWQLVRRASRYDVVLNGQIPWEAVATGLVCPLLGKPSMVMPASTGPAGDVRQIVAAKGSGLLRRLVLNNHRFLALSAEASAELQSLGCESSSIRRMSNGVDLRRYAPHAQEAPERARTVLWVARLVGAKNPHVLLRAWQRLNVEGRYRLLLAGDGPLAAKLQQFAQLRQLRNVHFLGTVEDIASLHRQASVFCLPSFGEGCSNALLEAMAGGLCPVVSRVAGNVDVVRDRVNGLVFDDDDDGQLARQLARALEDAPLRRSLSARARAYVVANHDLDRVAGELLGEFETLAASRTRWRAVKSLKGA